MITKSKQAPDGKTDLTKAPRHVAIIMDGNGRWAKKRGMPRLAGHRAGVDNLRPILEAAVEFGIQVLTVYAFSTENWSRPQPEVSGLMRLFRIAFDRELNNLHQNGVCLRHVGKAVGLPGDMLRSIRVAEEKTKDNTRITLNIAFNYGGRAEIVDAVRRIVAAGVPEDAITEELLSQFLYTATQPDPDLIIRTAGEMRLSNFLIWQAAYAEYYATPVCWPDFNKAELRLALDAYAQRERRFGKV